MLRTGCGSRRDAPGCPWDNSVAESAFWTIKKEMFHHRFFSSRVAACAAVKECIAVWYNRKRPYTANGGVSPQAVLDSYQERDPLALTA